MTRYLVITYKGPMSSRIRVFHCRGYNEYLDKTTGDRQIDFCYKELYWDKWEYWLFSPNGNHSVATMDFIEVDDGKQNC